ncbi:restriction endonuclease [Brevibacillus marinus]|uniref:nSTAND3 domain-containing NTPase n=1 Tax=Brevibacillus marinus TaxID=2496837 RepID=UPI000F84E242|nr:ATP-binding protein [Brevibacillus marinus]
MPNYDFHALLEPLEFEKLVCDIVQQRDGIFLKMFKAGRDSGIDGSYIDNSNQTIVQAKRHRPEFSTLYRELKNEVPKVRKLQPARYILGVSMELSRNEVYKIIELFEGFIVNERDILDRKDMNRLLEEPTYKQILLKYPKLWFPNPNVLGKLLNESVHRAAYKESAEELKEAFKTTKTFVSTRIYREALQKWSQYHVIVLSGEPGVGKTTMAYILALAYLQPNNLDGFVWANSIENVYALLEDEQKQVFILDDFWGSIFWGDHSRRNDEARLNKLISRIVESHGEKRLILTTREYILQQGLQKHPLLKKTLEQHALICTMEEYGDDEKARILFSHLYASNLEYAYVHYLYMKTDSIVHNPNYNPRVLTLFLKNNKPDDDCFPEDYYYQLCDFFDNPEEFWKDIFLELSSEAQIAAMLLLISSTPMHLESMEHCYQKYIHNCTVQMTVKNLGDCIAELEKTMIKSFYSEEFDAVLLKFSMPAVQDFLFTHLKENCEQFVPQLIKCCAYYNQLQFLLEHLSVHCSDTVTDLIVQQCILHYHDYDRSIIEYDGSWNWDIDLLEETGGYLDRFFHLLRCCQSQKHPALYRFLETEIKEYCLTMGNGDLEAQYHDLHNLPGIIVRCVKMGMTFNEKDIIRKYYENAFSVYHYLEMQKFQEVFPEEYALFHKTYYRKIRSEIKNTILCELEFLIENGMYIEVDVLIDNIPDLLKKFELRYTKEFGRKISALCGREPLLIHNKEVIPHKPSHDDIDWDEQSLEIVKEDAGNWLLGPTETYLDDKQMIEYISQSNLNPVLKEKLMEIVDTTTPRYVYNFLQTKETIELLLAALYDAGTHIPKGEIDLIMTMLQHIAQGDQVLMQKLVGFCAESLPMFIYRDEPVLRTKQFLESDVYTTYLQNNAQLREAVFEQLIMRDEQWVRFLHIPLYIFCYACVICFGSEDEELETLYPEIWGDNFNKLKQVVRYDSIKQTNILYADYGPYYLKNYEWEGCMYRMFEELKPYHFNQTYVAPMIKSYLDKLGDGNETSKVLKHISLSGLQFVYKGSGIPDYFIHEMSDELCMIEHLAIAEIWDGDFPPQITKSKLIELQKHGMAHQDDDKWTVLVYKIMDIELLKEFGVYDAAVKFLKEVESTYSRFINSDFSQIMRPF